MSQDPSEHKALLEMELIFKSGILEYMQFKKLVKAGEASPFCRESAPPGGGLSIHLSEPAGAER